MGAAGLTNTGTLGAAVTAALLGGATVGGNATSLGAGGSVVLSGVPAMAAWTAGVWVLCTAPGAATRVIMSSAAAVPVLAVHGGAAELASPAGVSWSDGDAGTGFDARQLAGAWHFVAVGKEAKSGTASVYVDGLLVGVSMQGGNVPAVLGAVGPWASLAASVASLAIYDRALTADEVLALYQAGAPCTLPAVPLLNYSDATLYNLTVTVSNGASPTPLASTATVLVTVTEDPNRFKPRMVNPVQVVTVNLSTPLNTVIASVQAVSTDPNNDPITYSVVGGQDPAFTLDSASGDIVFAAAPTSYHVVLSVVATLTFNSVTLTSDPAVVNITIVNQFPPVLTTAPSVVFTELGPAVALFPSLTLTDADGSNDMIWWATVTLLDGRGGDALQFTGSSKVGAVVAPHTVSITGERPVAEYVAALRAVVFANADALPLVGDRTVTVTVSDGTFVVSSNVTVTFVLIEYNPPVLSLGNGAAGFNVTFTEGSPAIFITSSSTSLTQADSGVWDIINATVVLSGPSDGTQEALSVGVSSSTITVGYNPATRTLTLTGPASIGDFQMLLGFVQFSDTSRDPALPAVRVATFTVCNAVLCSAAVQSNIAITLVDDAPVAYFGSDVHDKGTTAVYIEVRNFFHIDDDWYYDANLFAAVHHPGIWPRGHVLDHQPD